MKQSLKTTAETIVVATGEPTDEATAEITDEGIVETTDEAIAEATAEVTTGATDEATAERSRRRSRLRLGLCCCSRLCLRIHVSRLAQLTELSLELCTKPPPGRTPSSRLRLRLRSPRLRPRPRLRRELIDPPLLLTRRLRVH